MSSKLFKQSSIYSLAKLFTALTGLITFPLLTKNLSVADYGLIALFTTTLGLLTTLNKMGIQHSIIRFQQQLGYASFITNCLHIIGLLILITSVFILVAGSFAGLFTDHVLLSWPALLLITASAVMQAIQSFTINLLVSQEKSLGVLLLDSCYRILSLSGIVIIILFINATPIGFIYAVFSADCLLTFGILIWLKKQALFKFYQRELLKKDVMLGMLAFGLPMLGYEMSNMVHAFADRFLIEYMLGTQWLGLYSVPYNMAMLIGTVLFGGLATAIVPTYLRTWENEGKAATEALLNKINRFLLLLAPPIICGQIVVAEPLIELLATKDYLSSAHLLPVITAGVLLFNTSIIFAAGMQIKKDSKRIFRIVLEATALNLILNLVSIPAYGLEAAAVNTLIGYLWMAIRFYQQSNKILKINFDWLLLLRATLYSVAFTLICLQINTDSTGFTLLLRMIMSMLIFGFITLLFERNIRAILINVLRTRL